MPVTAPNIKLKLPPRTALEVFEMLPEGTQAEVINNTIYMPPSPGFDHQDVLGDLYAPIKTHVKTLGLGKCVVAPMDVYLDDRNIVQPDILFIKTENLSIIKDRKVNGTPDLIVEVLSSNRRHDLAKKKALYEAFGVKEYFIVDPQTKETITYYHNGKKYIQQEGRPGEIKSEVLKKVFSF